MQKQGTGLSECTARPLQAQWPQRPPRPQHHRMRYIGCCTWGTASDGWSLFRLDKAAATPVHCQSAAHGAAHVERTSSGGRSPVWRVSPSAGVPTLGHALVRAHLPAPLEPWALLCKGRHGLFSLPRRRRIRSLHAESPLRRATA